MEGKERRSVGGYVQRKVAGEVWGLACPQVAPGMECHLDQGPVEEARQVELQVDLAVAEGASSEVEKGEDHGLAGLSC